MADIQYSHERGFGIQQAPPRITCKLELEHSELLKIIEAEDFAIINAVQSRQEAKLREHYPAVKQAYEHYQMLITLTKDANE